SRGHHADDAVRQGADRHALQRRRPGLHRDRPQRTHRPPDRDRRHRRDRHARDRGRERGNRPRHRPLRTAAVVTTIGIIGAGEVGGQLARAVIRNGYQVVIANSRGPETLTRLVAELGPAARAATAADAAAAGDFVIIAVPLKLDNDMPTPQLAGKIVLDTNNYMPWRDGHYEVVDSGEKTVHEIRQEQLPASKVAK